ncbi:cupredoxin domain-containing protein [Rhodococcus sp. NPDC003322]
MDRKNVAIWAASAAVTVALGTGCYSPRGVEITDAGTPTRAAALVISIENHAYVPTTLTVRPGVEVTVGNGDDVEHSVTSDDPGEFDQDVRGRSTTTFAAPMAPGTYPFHCTFHPTMHGTLVVQ